MTTMTEEQRETLRRERSSPQLLQWDRTSRP